MAKDIHPELQVMLKQKAKVYLVKEQRYASVKSVAEEKVTLDIGTAKQPQNIYFEMHEYLYKITNDAIVLKKRAIFDEDGYFVRVEPLSGQQPKEELPEPKQVKAEVKKEASVDSEFETGWINEKTRKFSDVKKRGYTEIEFRRKKRTVELQLTDDKIEELKRMGIL